MPPRSKRFSDFSGRTLAIVGLLCWTFACSDAAHREYLAALRAEEDGSTRVKALAHVDRAIALAPDRVEYHKLRAIYRIDAREFDRARLDLDRALELSDGPYLFFLRGLVLCQGGRHVEALSDFDRAIAGQPRNTQFYRGRSLALSATGSYTHALRDAERLVADAPQAGESYYSRGLARAGLGDLPGAIADFDEALARRPELVYPLEARAAAYEGLGDHARAVLDSDAAQAARLRRETCAACLDPFRY